MQTDSLQNNRGFLFGDAVFETVKIVDQKVLFVEDHYFRLMASMRILRMEIPMDFTLEHFENIILEEAQRNDCAASARARITVFRKGVGLYLPEQNEVGFIISVNKIENSMYQLHNETYEVDIYKDFHVSKQLISTLKTTNRIINVTGSIYAKENRLDNCILLNDDKNVAEALNGNIFMLKDNILSTPPLSEGCLNGIMRKQVLAIAKTIESIEVKEAIISPFDLQKADELFITNTIRGIQPITKYRKKEFQTALAENLVMKINVKIRLG